MVYAAGQPPGTVITTDEIANHESVPLSFLRKTLPRLVQAGLIHTHRGAGGGIILARAPDEITLYDIVTAMEGPIALNRCLMRPGECPRQATCAIHDVLYQMQESLIQHLQAADLASLVEREGEKARI
jgi:Rrf2 family protein